MATEGGGKMKTKRHKDPETPYNRRRSLIGQVTDTVRGVIGGSWLTNLVNSVRKTPPKEGASKETREDGSSRGKYAAYPRPHSQGGSFLMTPGRDNIAPNVDPMTYNPAQVPYTPYMQMAQHVMVNGGDRRNEYPHTPGFSPVVSGDSSEYPSNMLHLNDSRLQQLRQEFQQGVPHSPLVADHSPVTHPGKLNLGETTVAADEGSFLWSTKPRRQPEPQPQVPSKITKASFNASVFGSSIGDKSVLSGTFGGQSPFYPGKTTFGGASSQRRTQSTPAPYQLPSRKLVASKPLPQNSAGGVSSSTAKKILETLEKMSTPLTDAKKIPTHDQSASLLITPVRRRTVDKSKLKEGPPTQQLTPLGFASIAPNKTVFNKPSSSRNNPGPSTSLNKQADGSCTSSAGAAVQKPDIQTSVNNSTFGDYATSKASGKMKREKGSHHYSSKTVDEDEHVETPDLPTNFTLQLSNFTPLSNLPMFNLSSSNVGSNPSQTAFSAKSAGNFSVANKSRQSDNFTFSSPIAKGTPSASFQSTTPDNFEFSSPIKVQGSSTESTGNGPCSNKFGSSSSKPMFDTGLAMKPGNPAGVKMKPFGGMSNCNEESPGLKPAKALKQGSVMDILGKSPSGGLGPAAELKKGSVMDILGKPSGARPASELKSGSVMDILKSASGNTNVAEPKSTQSTTNGLLFGKSSAVSATKSDSDIIIKSSSDKSGSEKMETKSSPCLPTPVSVSAASSNTGFGSMFNKPADSWDCSACMVQNKSGSTKCVACETPKPGTKPTPSMPSIPAPSTTSGFGNMFSKPSGSWECSACMVSNKADVTKCAACETPKPGAKPAASSQPVSSGFGTMFSKRSGSWECSTCMVANKSADVKCAACETPKPGAKPAPSLPTVPASSGWSGFAVKTSASSSWECNTCLVMNKPDATKCIACETPKPGAKPTTGFTSPGRFKFGSSGGLKLPAAAATTSSTANFGSGAAFVPSTAPPAAGGFKLPAASETKPETKETPATSSSGGFKFGAVSTEKVTPSTGGFKFPGQSSDKKEEKPQEKPAAFVGFKLGNVSSPSAPKTNSDDSALKTNSMPVIGGFHSSEKTDSSPALGGFKFNTSSKVNSDSSSKPATAGFNFSTPAVSTVQSAVSTGTKPAPTVDSTVTPAPFSFSKTDSNVSGVSKVEASKPAMTSSLFSVSNSQTASPKTDSSSTATPSTAFSLPPFSNSGFQFGSTNNADKGGFAFSATTKGPDTLGKRTRDDVDGPSPMKKSPSTFFGNPSNASSAAAAPFKFGETTTSSSIAGSASSLFTFSANSSNKTDAPATGSAGPFGGGLGNAQPSSTPFSNTGFGTTNSNVFGSMASQPKQTAPAGGIFGATTATSAPAAAAPNTGSTGGFQFGSTTTSMSAGLFQFGATANKPQTNITPNAAPIGSSNGSSGFAFGQMPSDVSTPQFFTASPTPSINFAATPTAGTIQFGASTDSNTFSMGRAPASNPAPRRQMKKAVRKLKK